MAEKPKRAALEQLLLDRNGSPRELPSKEVLLLMIAGSPDWRAQAWLVDRLEGRPDEKPDGVDEVAKKRAARRKRAAGRKTA